MDKQTTPDPVPSAPPAPEPATPATTPTVPTAPASPPPPPVNESLSSIQQNISDLRQSTMNAVTKPFTSGSSSSAISSLVIGSAFAFLVAFILYWIITYASNLSHISFQVPDSKTPKTGYEVNQLSAEGLPSLSSSGTISFWLYVNEFPDVVLTSSDTNTANVNYRHVWHRGDRVWNPELISPMVLLKSTKSPSSAQQNSLLVSFPSSDKANLLDNAFTGIPNRNMKIEYMVATRGITIDYIPVKRWVHIAITVDKKKKLMKSYVDGQLMKTMDVTKRTSVRTNTNPSSNPVSVPRKVDTLELNGSGDIYVGGRPTSDLGLGFPGLVSNIRFSNWEMSNFDVYREYKRGPVDNLMAKLGLPAYGLQSPIYKML